jgi:hypothetical protein
MVDVSPYFDNFPKINYSLSDDKKITDSVTNIFKRYAMLREVLSNSSSYVLYEIDDGDTPEIIAEKVYNDAGAGWIILYANQIMDPQFDWHLSDANFKNYIEAKYGSVAAAQSTVHHYEKVVETTVDGETYRRVYGVGKERYTEVPLNVPYTYYTPYNGSNNWVLTADTNLLRADNTAFTADHSNHSSYNDTSLPEYFSYEAHTVNGKTVTMNTYGNAVSNYDYDYNLNDNRKYIKVIKKQYYTQIMTEFKAITKGVPSYVRTLV